MERNGAGHYWPGICSQDRKSNQASSYYGAGDYSSATNGDGV